MEPAHLIATDNKEIVNDLSFDWSGKRLAIVTAERKIKIYTKENPEDDPKVNWVLTSDFSAHLGPIWKIKWAHPDFGSIIATCSYDKSIHIWEEKKCKYNGPTSITNKNQKTEWIIRLRLYENKDSVEDIKFAPKNKGWLLGAAFADGRIIIYDITGLNSQKIIGEFHVDSVGLNTLSWNKNIFDATSLIVGSKEPPSALCDKDKGDDIDIDIDSSPVNLVDTGSRNCMSLWFKKEGQGWKKALNFEYNGLKHEHGVNDISWAMLNGRSFHTVASAGRDGVFVWRFKFEKSDKEDELNATIMDAKRFQLDCIPIRVTWNFMATLLIVSASNSSLTIWKKNHKNNWEKIRQLLPNFKEEGDVDAIM